MIRCRLLLSLFVFVVSLFLFLLLHHLHFISSLSLLIYLRLFSLLFPSSPFVCMLLVPPSPFPAVSVLLIWHMCVIFVVFRCTRGRWGNTFFDCFLFAVLSLYLIAYRCFFLLVSLFLFLSYWFLFRCFSGPWKLLGQCFIWLLFCPCLVPHVPLFAFCLHVVGSFFPLFSYFAVFVLICCVLFLTLTFQVPWKGVGAMLYLIAFFWPFSHLLISPWFFLRLLCGCCWFLSLLLLFLFHRCCSDMLCVVMCCSAPLSSGALEGVGAMLYLIAFFWPFSRVVKLIVEEKASRVKEGLRMLGMKVCACACATA